MTFESIYMISHSHLPDSFWFLDLINGWGGRYGGTFNNISIISWQSVLLVEETGVHRENH
jgi:hypothetical protein